MWMLLFTWSLKFSSWLHSPKKQVTIHQRTGYPATAWGMRLRFLIMGTQSKSQLSWSKGECKKWCGRAQMENGLLCSPVPPAVHCWCWFHFCSKPVSCFFFLSAPANCLKTVIIWGFKIIWKKNFLRWRWGLGYTWWNSRVTLGSELRNNSWQCFGGHMGCWGTNPGQASNLSAVLSFC